MDEKDYVEVCLENQKMIASIYRFIKSIDDLPVDSEKNRNIKLCLETIDGENLRNHLK